jgi:hypothetical protein
VIKLFCDCCGKETNKLYSINTKLEYSNQEEYNLYIHSYFPDKDDVLINKSICLECKKLIWSEASKKFKEIQLQNAILI